MREFLIGQIEDKIIFTTLPQVGDPIVKGLDQESELFACFLSEWNSTASVQTLLEYLLMILKQDKSNDEFEEISRFGIYNDHEGSRLLFVEDGIIIKSGSIQTKTILVSQAISIVEKWKMYLTLAEKEDTVFYGGRFFSNPKTKEEIEGSTLSDRMD